MATSWLALITKQLLDPARLTSVHSTVPFEEDERDPNIWFLDHSYLEGMSAMFKKVNGANFLVYQPIRLVKLCAFA